MASESKVILRASALFRKKFISYVRPKEKTTTFVSEDDRHNLEFSTGATIRIKPAFFKLKLSFECHVPGYINFLLSY